MESHNRQATIRDMKVVIGIGGEKYSGKDTIADFFVERFDFTKISFADPLRDICSKASGIPVEEFLNEALKDEFIEDVHFGIDKVNALIEATNTYRPLNQKERAAVTKALIGNKFDTRRKILQFVGSEVFRQVVEENFWVNILKSRVSQHKKVIVPDMRFENERAAINSMKGILMRVERPVRNQEGTPDRHISELSLGNANEYDVHVLNDSTLANLYQGLDVWYNHIFNGVSIR
jgi:hypothetical protein